MIHTLNETANVVSQSLYHSVLDSVSNFFFNDMIENTLRVIPIKKDGLT